VAPDEVVEVDEDEDDDEDDDEGGAVLEMPAIARAIAPCSERGNEIECLSNQSTQTSRSGRSNSRQ
jgi:hypothetical protein